MISRYAIQKRKLYEEVVDKIAALAETNNYKIGDRLPSLQELSELFDVGKPTLREALSVLASVGSIEIRHGSGIFIKKLPLKNSYDLLRLMDNLGGNELRHWLEFRRVVEVAAAELAAKRRTEGDMEALEKAYLRIKKEINLGIATSAGYEFHNCIALASHNPIFVHAYNAMDHVLKEYAKMSLRQSVRLPNRRDSLLGEHRAIMDAIKNGDSLKAKEAMLKHINIIAKQVHFIEDFT